jgi:DNA polymerase III epsilon subunit-like protein
MFATIGLFKGILCPKTIDCQLLNCIFSHDVSKDDSASTNSHSYDPASAGTTPAANQTLLTTNVQQPAVARIGSPAKNDRETVEADEGTSVPPPFKKRRLGSDVTVKRQDGAQVMPASVNRHGSLSSPSIPRPSLESPQTEKVSNSSAVKSIRRPVSPPAIRGSKTRLSTTTTNTSKNSLLPIETLNPRMVSKAPESHKNRLTLLKILHQLMETLNKRIGEVVEDDSALLSPQELVRLALDEEEQMARDHQEGMYRSAITAKITRLKKLNLDDWRKYIMEKFPEKVPVKPSSSAMPITKSIVTGLSSVQEEIEILRLLRTPLEGLEGHGYVTVAPSEKEIDDSRKGVHAAAGFEVCDRCGARFQVFPGRNDEGRLTSHGSCRYHWGKLRRPLGQKTDRAIGQQEASFLCCNKGLGSEGCTVAESHVFKVTDPKRLASILQFESTPHVQASPRRMPDAVAFDCEMAFTTLGMELIRVTAISWPQNKELLDVLVRTQGEILDLNTRFSGVSPEAYVSAPPYDAEGSGYSDDTSEEGELESKPLQKVGSVAAARQLMFDLLMPETPLIGHAIDNDLNACRMIHPFVVDTVLLYPHPRGLPMRYGLKMLASKYLERGIQMGGALGHDSKEDATATGDLVKIKVKEEWQKLKLEGWAFEDENLVAPDAKTRLPS